MAEPQNIRDKFNEAEAAGHPLLERIELDTLITVVDSGTFITDYASRAALVRCYHACIRQEDTSQPPLRGSDACSH